MAEQIRFFKTNKFDFKTGATIVGDATWNENAVFLQDRRSDTFAADSATPPTLTDVGYSLGGGDSDINRIFILKHNIPTNNLRVQFVDTSAVLWTVVNAGVVNNLTAAGDITILHDGESTLISFENTVAVQQIRVGTQTSDSPSTGSLFRIAQLIGTEELGQLEGYPVISNNEFDQNLSIATSASGRVSVVRNVGAYSFDLSVRIWNVAADLSLIQSLYDQFPSFLVWINAGDTAQFSNPLRGFRFEDIYHVQATNTFRPQKYKGLYRAGYRIRMRLAEAL